MILLDGYTIYIYIYDRLYGLIHFAQIIINLPNVQLLHRLTCKTTELTKQTL